MAVSGCSTITLPEDGPSSVSDYLPTRKIGLFDTTARREELKENRAYAARLCPYGNPRNSIPIPRRVVGHGTQYNLYNNPNPYNYVVVHVDDQIAGWLLTGDRAYLDSLREWLLQSAAEGAFADIVADPDKYRYVDPLFNLRFGLKPVFMAYDLLQQQNALALVEDARLLEWLERVVETSDRGLCGEMEGWCHKASHTTLHAGTTYMLWGAVSANPEWFQKGIDYYVAGLRNTRSDGSNKWEVSPRQRERALRKQNQVVGYQVMIAEIAAQQGYDLYAVEVGGVSVLTMLDFLISALEDDDIVRRHSNMRYFGKDFISTRTHNDETMAWFEIFRRRFPDHVLVRRFDNIHTAGRPMSSPAYGGNLSCFVGLLQDG